MKETWIVARASGDQTYLSWLHARLIKVYKESPYVDYVQTLDQYVEYFKRRSEVPTIINWILRKYNL